MRRPSRYCRTKCFLCLIVLVTVFLVFISKKQSKSGFNVSFRSFFSDTKFGEQQFGSSPNEWPKIRIVRFVPRDVANRAAANGREESKSPVTDYANAEVNRLNNKTTKNADRQVCRLPKLILNESDIIKFFKHVDPLKCNPERNWVYTKDGKFFIDESALNQHGSITCSYTKLWRLTDYKTASKKYDNYKSGSPLMSDFFKADCTSADGKEYSNVHASILPSAEAINRANTVSKSPSDNPDNFPLNLNVYMMAFDSLSRMSFMRKLPKTYDYLKTRLNAIVMEGYNIVGDGTPQALIPMLTGKTETELPLTRKRYANANYVNVYPFVWKEFRDAGYVTSFGEDQATVGTFTYRLKGFNEQPTDHYMRTFYTVAEPFSKSHVKFCWGSEPHHKVHFDYSEALFRNYPRSTRKFAFQFHSILSHDDINLVEVADDDMTKHLQAFFADGYLNDTLLVFFSDHGNRFEQVRETQQGKLEERLPFMAFVLPPWFEAKYPKAVQNLRTNAGRLSTPFDIHATLQSVLKFRYPPKMGDIKKRDISLFDEVPIGRSCRDADVEPHWCACLSWTTVPTTDLRVKYIADALVAAINAETAKARDQCAVLTLKSVEKALQYSPNSDLMHYKKAADKDGFVPDLSGTTEIQLVYFQVTFRTMPADQLYEASVTWDKRVNELVISVAEISHITTYGDLPHCVIDKDYFLAKWCVCYDKVKQST